MATTPVQIVLQFIEAINHQDIELLTSLMSNDHVFIDAGGMEVRGRDNMRQAWSDYFRMVPDYEIIVQETLSSGGTVVVLGTGQGT